MHSSWVINLLDKIHLLDKDNNQFQILIKDFKLSEYIYNKFFLFFIYIEIYSFRNIYNSIIKYESINHIEFFLRISLLMKKTYINEIIIIAKHSIIVYFSIPKEVSLITILKN